ncbi:hypothetical protein Vretifemale_15817 [Volvox reticuliferus]|uniref:AAA+ ATPase domain-containing protein n=1 Tax=Volvox reticuliferus TaxID=1737510 RepID=A0A8J4CW93_9CHLO|nr:hypothetical protein Vretifemale_15817 [Volvox reticuliferus]
MKVSGLPCLPMRTARCPWGRTTPFSPCWPSEARFTQQRRLPLRVSATDAESAVAVMEASPSNGARTPAVVAAAVEVSQEAVVEPLPEKNFGVLRGGRYPFLYDNLYGLPVVRQVASYGEALEGLRSGRITEVLWFQPLPANTVGGSSEALRTAADGRCLLRYASGQVKQSVIPYGEPRIMQAIHEYGAAAGFIPLEPRHKLELAAVRKANYAGSSDPVAEVVGTAAMEEEPLTGVTVEPPEGLRRGPPVGPTTLEALLAYGTREQLDETLSYNKELAASEVSALLAKREAWLKEQEDIEEAARLERSAAAAAAAASSQRGAAAGGFSLTSWLDSIQLTNEQQALVLKYVPLLGPVLGSGFILGLYLLARLVKGDLTDRMKMMDLEAEKKKKMALKEARIAFLEEEVPGMVAKGATIDEIRSRCRSINSRLGSKLAIADSELVSTYDACRMLLSEGVDLSAVSSSAATASLAQMESDERKAAAMGAEGGGDESMNALMDMGKLNTARIRKATDPKILDVKKRVRDVRRKLKRESKVQLSDEIIFFDDVAGNKQAKVELMEVVDFFRTPEKFRASGARAPKGVLLVGPPGNGKTLMARAVAGESGVAFISSSAAEFIEMYMGLGAARVRDLFNTARSVAPCIIFIDELDAVGRQRQGAGRSNDERDNTVNQLLTEMDGFEAEQQGIVVMGATNRKDVLDAALTRPGRFDSPLKSAGRISKAGWRQ